jgi:hypothetical protein
VELTATNDKQLFRDLFICCFVNLFLFYALSGLLLFTLIGWTVAMGFRSFGQELISKSLLTNTRDNDDASLDGFHLMIIKWKKLHILLIDTVDGINDCFGPVLLIWVSYIFVGFIASLFYIADEVYFNSTLSYSSWAMLIISSVQVAQHILHFLIITGVPNYIRREVHRMCPYTQICG